ncbi:ABC transporter ATP-binding protein [Haloactinomyces albus]|uniref:Branched-chain amino acid transport system ATP-binding protein n=1 Tax=Haloactinomyces albus TaxID=1352928 RepID=A0AAE4CMZ6_9ACTN|nr:ABC transporter ATP-binding protein [Haloactinomyces albus]MDR7303955.1 branched-chain amino acid transport system ATP-binding protein [Haloactinomyces albus]
MLEIHDLHVSYGRVEAVRGLSASVVPGRVTLVLGANGAGKSTTLRAATGLVPADSGEVVLDGQPITGMATHKIVRNGLVLVPEGRQVFAPLTVEENLVLGGYVAKKEQSSKELDRVYEMFPVLRERRRGPAGLLSGGEQQMLAFGRALMSAPRAMMMDEPSMGLAPAMVESVLGTVRDIANSGIALLVVEQNADMGLEIADDVVVVARGEVVFSGPAEQARSDTSVVRAFLGEAALGA